MPTEQTLYAAVIVLISAILQASTGFGFALVAVPLLMLVLPAKVVVHVVMVLSACSLLVICLRNYRYANLFLLYPLIAGGLVGVPLGLRIFTQASPDTVRSIAAVITVAAGAYFLLSLVRKRASTPDQRTIRPLNRVCTLGVGCLSGLLAATASMPGPPVIVAMNWAGLSKREFRATSTTYFTVLYCMSLIMLVASQALAMETLEFAVPLIPLALLGTFLGEHFFRWISEETFAFAVSLLLIMTAASNLLR